MRLYTTGFLSACAAVAVLTACGANGFLGTTPAPDGNIVVTLSSDSVPIVTSPTNPYPIGSTVVSFHVGEKHFNGQFTANVIDANTTPCFVPKLVDGTVEPNLFTITAVGAPPPTAAPTANPSAPPTPVPVPVIRACQRGNTETLLFADNRGHSAHFYYVLTATFVQ